MLGTCCQAAAADEHLNSPARSLNRPGVGIARNESYRLIHSDSSCRAADDDEAHGLRVIASAG
jgi:hypothetical protein